MMATPCCPRYHRQVNAAVITGVLLIQVVFTSLDLAERHRTRDERPPIRAATVWFLLAVILVFFAIQIGLMALAPRIDVMMSTVQRWTPGSATRSDMPFWPIVLVSVLAFYIGSLFDYLVHRFFNHSNVFWWTHEYHHLPREVFVALPGLSVRPFSVFTAIPTAFGTICVSYGVIWLAGWPAWDLRPLGFVALANAFILTTSHSEWLRRWWWPHHLLRTLALTTPHEHLVHHAVDRPGNYGNIVSLWDRLFGTYRDPLDPDNQGRELGLTYDQDFLGTLTLGRLKLPASWRKRFQVDRYCRLDEPEDKP
ncbi:MAG: sterol desaturase/sphingolipid hydroxylase (fatty acid hydroxylase superfamily) [Myxococcota bacterium]|jgi:sterol desaturase/sphingolipid hydroxylase (fatty acid hydroxylase superfamily)